MRVIRGKTLKFTPASHEEEKNPGSWKKVLLKTGEISAGHIQMINWAKIPVGKAFRSHYHELMEEIFIIISGTASASVEKEKTELKTGDVLIISPGEHHVMANIGSSPLIYIALGIVEIEGGKTIVE